MLFRMVEMAIRAAQVTDAETIAQVQVRTWQATYRGFMPDAFLDGLQVADRQEANARILQRSDPAAGSFVGTVDGVVRGFIHVGPARHDFGDADPLHGWGELQGIYVAPDAQGLGLGHALEAEGRVSLQRAGFTRAYLWVVTGNTGAEQFYAARGWHPDGVTQTFDVPGAKVPEHRLVVDL